MLRSVIEFYNYVLEAEDGQIGRCKDFLFDDEHWTVRYMVADTGKWLPGEKVLISPISLGEADWNSNLFQIKLTKKQIENSPSLASHAPVSKQLENEWFEFFGYTLYGDDIVVWGAESYPGPLFDPKNKKKQVKPEGLNKNPHLRSAKEVIGYHIQAKDGEIGHVKHLILDDETWTIRYMVVDTRKWLLGRMVLVAPHWVNSINWHMKKVIVDLRREVIKNSPKYDPHDSLNREYEENLYDFYSHPKYWE